VAVAMDNAILENILRQVRPLIGQGKVADYIPALATVDGSRLGIAICTVDGQLFQAGDAQERFSIQSISKVLSLVVAMRHYSEEEIWQRVGKDPSGSPFNSLVQLEMEQGIPRNPFINAGALVVCDMLQGRLSAPRQRMLEVVRGLSGVSDISYDTVVARSEFEHSARNAAIAWLMKSFGNFHHDVTTVLQNYFHYCALKMSCVELARTFVFLARSATCFISELIAATLKETIIGHIAIVAIPRRAENICGMENGEPTEISITEFATSTISTAPVTKVNRHVTCGV
jgi:glutaminase